jgi:hypothetical protein
MGHPEKLVQIVYAGVIWKCHYERITGNSVLISQWIPCFWIIRILETVLRVVSSISELRQIQWSSLFANTLQWQHWQHTSHLGHSTPNAPRPNSVVGYTATIESRNTSSHKSLNEICTFACEASRVHEFHLQLGHIHIRANLLKSYSSH